LLELEFIYFQLQDEIFGPQNAEKVVQFDLLFSELKTYYFEGR
jgi:hypothetical protein